jgi:hypothetical protein
MSEGNTEQYTDALQDELNHFREEKEKVRQLVGQIGGKKATKRDKIINKAFIICLIGLFVVDIIIILFKLDISLITTEFTIILALLMVSLKIIWMIHKQAKVEHFQFWILNSIEFRLNDISKRIKNIEKKID